MKKIVCELCGCAEFVKEGGFFICQGCGTKYSLEETKKMMQEVEDETLGAPAASNYSASEGNPNLAQIDNILLLATSAYSAGNNEEAEKNCNRVIELDATCYKAWMLKGKAAGWQSTIQNPRIVEAAHLFKQAIDFAPAEEKDNLTEEAAEELKRLGLSCISLRQKRYSKSPDQQELNGFVSDIEPLADGFAVLLSKEKDVAEIAEATNLLNGSEHAELRFLGMKPKALRAGVPKEYFSQIAAMMGNAAVEGFITTSNKYNNDNHPMMKDFTKTANEVDNCIKLLDFAIGASDDDDDDDIKRYECMIKMQEYVVNMSAYEGYSSSVRTVELTDSAKILRKIVADGYRKKIKEIEDKAKARDEEERKKAVEKKQARIKAFWEAHADEKAILDSNLEKLNAKKDKLIKELTDLDSQISIIKDEEKTKVPSEVEIEKLNDQISNLSIRKSKLGWFSGKEKKRIDEEIVSLQESVSSLKDRIVEEKKAKKAACEQRVLPLQSQKEALNKELDGIRKDIADIEAKLSKDPEE